MGLRLLQQILTTFNVSRICPGRYIAERNGVLFVARLLQACEILPEEGALEPVKVTFGDSLVR
jgi:hypothetical protein